MTKTELQEEVYRRLLWHGWTPEQACGVMGNIQQESGFDTVVLGFDKTGSFGLCQWLGPRKSGLKGFARMRGLDYRHWQTQVDWFDYETRTTERSAGDRMRCCKTPREAALCMSRYYERPHVKYAHNSKRVAYAEEFYRRFRHA